MKFFISNKDYYKGEGISNTHFLIKWNDDSKQETLCGVKNKNLKIYSKNKNEHFAINCLCCIKVKENL